jgi:hypothetical protein
MTSSARWVEAAADIYACSELVPLDCPRDIGPDGRFTLHEVIGMSDRSWVYRATDNRLSNQHFSSTVAVKLTRPTQRGTTEALLSRAVEHQHAVRVIDCGTLPEGFDFVVSEWMDGGTLGHKPVAMSQRAIATLIVQISGAVQAAHARGIVHCDIKPDNVLLDKAGTPKLADFDLAFFSPLDDGGWRGTPAFMAPEQLLNHADALTPQADVYGLGALFYWCLYGRPPHGENEEDLRQAATQKRTADVSTLPTSLAKIVLRALAPDRAERYQSVFEFASDLQAWLDHRPIYWQNPGLLTRSGLLFARHPAKSVATIAITIALVGGGLTARWLHEREVTRQREASEREATRQREASEREVLRQREADAKSVAMANAAVNETKARLRAQVRSNFASLRQQKPGSIEQFGPALIFAQWLGQAPVFGEGDEPVEVDGRVELLQRLISEGAAKGQGSGVAVLATRMALLDVYMQSQRFDETLELLESMKSAHQLMLKADPSLNYWLEANELAARLELDNTAAANAPTKLSSQQRSAMLTKLETLIAQGGLEGPFFSRAQRKQLEVGK